LSRRSSRRHCAPWRRGCLWQAARPSSSGGPRSVTITHEGSERIIAEHERRVAEIEALRAKDGSNAQQLDQLIAQSAAVRDAQLSQLRAKEVEAAEKVRAANERVVASLEPSARRWPRPSASGLSPRR
jgi:hypothetical protein